MPDRAPARAQTPTFVVAICATLLFGATTLAASPPTTGRAATTHRLDIPAQGLGTALKALGAAVNEQVLFSEDLVAGRHSPPLKGEYSTDEAVTLLLEGSGLKADRTASGILLIRSLARPLPVQQQGSPATDAGKKSLERISTGSSRSRKNVRPSLTIAPRYPADDGAVI